MQEFSGVLKLPRILKSCKISFHFATSPRWSFFAVNARTCDIRIREVPVRDSDMGEDSMKMHALVTILGVMVFGCSDVVVADQISDAVQQLQSASAGGVGATEARNAVRMLSGSGESALLPVLKGFQGSNPVAVNWLRNAFEELVAAQQAAKKPLPADVLEAFIRDESQSPVARRLAYENLKTQDPEIEGRLIPDLLQDPSPEFRRDAVARLIDESKKASDAAASTALLKKAFSGAVHEDQVKDIAESLRKNGETVNIQRHFGFVPKWMIIGPFDNKDEKGFAVAYTPETELADGKPIDLAAEYDGQLGKVKWMPIATEDDYGVVDIAKQIENYKGSLMYATATWTSAGEQQVEIRLGTPNSWKLWVNGKLVFEREEYHRSSQMDQYSVPISLKSGENTLMLKVCQNEQTQDWAQRYQFQLRVCDQSGSAVLPATSTAKNNRQTGAQQ